MSRRTWALYGATTKTSSIAIGRVLPSRSVHPFRMDPVRGLSQLVRIAQQYKVVCRASDCQNVCERHLPSFVNYQVIQLGREAGASEEPRRAGNDLNLVSG